MSIADNLAVYVDSVYWAPQEFNSLQIFLGIIFFSFQIYADFYGYSTIAMGSARMLGIPIMTNFNTPYLATSVTEFWQRWHISLSTWFRDYLYIPLGGNRVGVARWCFNILLVFMVSGLWHGASWNFVLWGTLHGVVILLERFATSVFKIQIPRTNSLVKVMLQIKTFLIVSALWVFFRATSFDQAKTIFKALFYHQNYKWNEIGEFLSLFLCFALIFTDVLLNRKKFDLRLSSLGVQTRWAIYALLLFGLLAMGAVQQHSFIYFQF
jgi:D-alanyl-lipoteichoic acid acyltransferase DltB (MBOAT superfamily)